MSENIQFNVISNEDSSISTEISELYIPAFYGEAGILENHLPFITMLGAGEVSYKNKEGKKNYLFVNGGFLENLDNKIFLLADEMIKGEDLKKEVITKSLSKVDEIIKSSIKGDISSEELEIKIKEQKALRSKLEIIGKM